MRISIDGGGIGQPYLMVVQIVTKNPYLQMFEEEANSQRFYGSGSSKPFQVSLSEEVGDNHLRSQKIQELDNSVNPTWLLPEPYMSDKVSHQKESIKEEVQSKFLGHSIMHLNNIRLHTDGRKPGSGVGCAVNNEGTVYTA